MSCFCTWRHWWLDCLFALLGSAPIKDFHCHVGEINPRAQFCQHFTYSFYAHRSQKHKKDSQVINLFYFALHKMLVKTTIGLPSIECSEIKGRFFATVLDVGICSVLKENTDGIEMSELSRRVQRCLLVGVLEENVSILKHVRHICSSLRLVILL